jgi:hypothetical protein
VRSTPIRKNQIISNDSSKVSSFVAEEERITSLVFNSTLVNPPSPSNFSSVASYGMNPGLPGTLPWGSKLGSSYSKHRLRRLEVIFSPQFGTTYNGQVGLSWVPDTLHPAPVSGTQQSQHATSAFGTVSCPLRLHVKACPDKLYTRAEAITGVDLKTYDHGRVFVSVEGLSTSTGSVPFGNVVFGYLTFKYHFDLFEKNEQEEGAYSTVIPVGSQSLGSTGDVQNNPLSAAAGAFESVSIPQVFDIHSSDPGVNNGTHVVTNECEIISQGAFSPGAAGQSGSPRYQVTSDGKYEVEMSVPLADSSALMANKSAMLAITKVPTLNDDPTFFPVVAYSKTPTFSTVGTSTVNQAIGFIRSTIDLLSGESLVPHVTMPTLEIPAGLTGFGVGSSVFKTFLTFKKIAEFGESLIPLLGLAAVTGTHSDLIVLPRKIPTPPPLTSERLALSRLATDDCVNRSNDPKTVRRRYLDHLRAVRVEREPGLPELEDGPLHRESDDYEVLPGRSPLQSPRPSVSASLFPRNPFSGKSFT